MKKFMISLMFIFLSITFVAGGVCLLQGCSQSTPAGDGGSSENPEDPNPETPDDDETKADGTTFNWSFYIRLKQIGGETYYPDYLSTDSSYKYTIARKCCFDVYWYDEKGNAANLTSDSESYETISSVGGLTYATSDTSSKNYKKGLINATYKYSSIWNFKRWLKIEPHINNSEAQFAGINGRGSTYRYVNGSSYCRTDTEAKNGASTTLEGTYGLYFKEGATYYFYGSSLVGQGNTYLTTTNGYAGGSISMPSFNGKTPLGYTFAGWTWDPNGSTVYRTGDSFDVNSSYNPHVSWTSFHASFVGNSMKLTLDANGGSISTTTGWTGSGTSVYRSNSYGSSLYDTALPTPTRTGYTFLGWRKNFFDVYSYANWINRYTDEAGVGDVTFSGKTMNMQPSRCYRKVNGEWQARTYSVDLPAAGQYRFRYYAYTDRTDGNPAGTLRLSTNDTTIKSISETQISATSRTYYQQTFKITEKTTVGVYFSWNYSGMCHLDNIVLELVSPTSGSWTADAFVNQYYSFKNDETLYAQWEINTYNLTVKYYGGTSRQTNISDNNNRK